MGCLAKAGYMEVGDEYSFSHRWVDDESRKLFVVLVIFDNKAAGGMFTAMPRENEIALIQWVQVEKSKRRWEMIDPPGGIATREWIREQLDYLTKAKSRKMTVKPASANISCDM